MPTYTDEELISGYLINYSGDESYFWAFEEMNDLISSDSERAYQVTCKLISRTKDSQTLTYIAAGPLEDILAYYGEDFIERIEALARQDPHFRLALKGVYASRFKSEIADRVHRLTNANSN